MHLKKKKKKKNGFLLTIELPFIKYRNVHFTFVISYLFFRIWCLHDIFELLTSLYISRYYYCVHFYKLVMNA